MKGRFQVSSNGDPAEGNVYANESSLVKKAYRELVRGL